ncbi:MAG: class I SAM-dependent methyltransferase [Verrucomicrobia bacterium]|nr:class I SAM-dependent methyltransferase [Verrucomicrobiota bacterium]
MLQTLRQLPRGVFRGLENWILYRRFRDFTMVPEAHFSVNLDLARRMIRVPGCIVECGVWKGGMTAAVASVLGTKRQYFLLDSFEGLPKAKANDGADAHRWQSDKEAANYYDNCTAAPSFAEAAMRQSGVHSFSIVKGWFEQTVPAFKAPEPIAFLRLDGDWYDSTYVCLNHLFDQLAPGAIVVIDDYLTWEGCRRAVHDFLSQRSATECLREEQGVTYFVRQAA